MDALVDQIFSKLSEDFPTGPSQTNEDVPGSPLAKADDLERLLRPLRLITRLRTTTVATKSYELFETIMQSSVPESTKMKAARLVLYPSYQQKRDPPVKDPEHIRSFLRYYNNLRAKRRDRATLVVPATYPPSNPVLPSRSRSTGNASGLLPLLPDQEELNWWGELCSRLGDGDEGGGRGQLEAMQDSNQGESGLGSSVGPPTS